MQKICIALAQNITGSQPFCPSTHFAACQNIILLIRRLSDSKDAFPNNDTGRIIRDLSAVQCTIHRLTSAIMRDENSKVLTFEPQRDSLVPIPLSETSRGIYSPGWEPLNVNRESSNGGNHSTDQSSHGNNHTVYEIIILFGVYYF